MGGARTALYNWLPAQKAKRGGDDGRFVIRIEDTDLARSTRLGPRPLVDSTHPRVPSYVLNALSLSLEDKTHTHTRTRLQKKTRRLDTQKTKE